MLFLFNILNTNWISPTISTELGMVKSDMRTLMVLEFGLKIGIIHGMAMAIVIGGPVPKLYPFRVTIILQTFQLRLEIPSIKGTLMRLGRLHRYT